MAVEDLPLRGVPEPCSVSGDDGPVEPTMSADDCVRLVGGALDALSAIGPVRHQLSAAGLARLTRDVLGALQLAESAAVGLVAEAEARGVIEESTAAGATQWVSRLSMGESIDEILSAGSWSGSAGPLVDLPGADVCGAVVVAESEHVDNPDDAPDPDASARPRVPGLEPSHAARIAKVATACREPRNHVMEDALASGVVGLPACKAALDAAEKVMPVLPTATRDDVFGWFLALPAGSGARAVRELTRRVIATYADERHLEDTDDRLQRVESITWADLPTGMVRFTADLAPLHAAQLRHALNALAAPSPGNTCCDDTHHRHVGEATGERDERTPGKRRADALMLLITRAAGMVDADPETPVSGQAKLVVTIDYETLVGQIRGFGVTEDGVALDPHLVRQIACDADILPMVLGGEGQPLDVGRRQRLVKGSLRAAVVQRDRHCTYPGCGRPPSWCQVHHVVPWHQGGRTSLDNSALLCPRHHTIVHRDDAVATVTDSGITWQLAGSPAAGCPAA